MSTAFDRALEMVLRFEGGLSLDPNDRGNWVSGRIGVGELRGTNCGISAAAFPDLDIQKLTRADIRVAYKLHYWNKVSGDLLPDPVNMVAFDAAVNCGVSRAAKWLQGAVGAAQDGIIGPLTLMRVCDHDPYDLAVEHLARRFQFMAGLPTWSRYGRGWSRRLVTVAALAARPVPAPPLFDLTQLGNASEATR